MPWRHYELGIIAMYMLPSLLQDATNELTKDKNCTVNAPMRISQFTSLYSLISSKGIIDGVIAILNFSAAVPD